VSPRGKEPPKGRRRRVWQGKKGESVAASTKATKTPPDRHTHNWKLREKETSKGSARAQKMRPPG